MTTTPEYAAIRRRMDELGIVPGKLCAACGMPLPRRDWKPSRCPECWAREGEIADRNRRIARGEDRQ